MSRFHPSRIERAKQGISQHDVTVPAHIRRVSRVIQWKILRDSRPAASEPQRCEIAPFRRKPRVQITPASPQTGGTAA